MARLVDPREAEVAVLAHFAVLGPVNDKGGVARGSECIGMRVVDGEGDGLPAEPVADVVGVAVVQSHADGVVEDHFEVGDEVRVGEVAGHLEGVGDVVVGLGVIEVDADCVLDGGLVEIVIEVAGRGRVIIGIPDVVDAAAAELVVGFFDVGTALVGGLLAEKLADGS